MRAINRILNLYRQTIKRSRLLHRFVYGITQSTLLPFLERVRRFRTPSTDPINFRIKLLTREWEPDTVRVVRGLVKPGDIAIDIGTHVGYYSVLLSKLVGAHGRVFAFEPHSSTFQLLKHNTARYSNVAVFEQAKALSINESG